MAANSNEIQDMEKHAEEFVEDVGGQATADLAQSGHAATDKYGNALVHFDPQVEARIRRKCDLFLCPVVALLYLFCFIDVSRRL